MRVSASGLTAHEMPRVVAEATLAGCLTAALGRHTRSGGVREDEVTRRLPRRAGKRGQLETLVGCCLPGMQDAWTDNGGTLAVPRWAVRRYTTRPPKSAAEADMSDGASSCGVRALTLATVSRMTKLMALEKLHTCDVPRLTLTSP